MGGIELKLGPVSGGGGRREPPLEEWIPFLPPAQGLTSHYNTRQGYLYFPIPRPLTLSLFVLGASRATPGTIAARVALYSYPSGEKVCEGFTSIVVGGGWTNRFNVPITGGILTIPAGSYWLAWQTYDAGGTFLYCRGGSGTGNAAVALILAGYSGTISVPSDPNCILPAAMPAKASLSAWMPHQLYVKMSSIHGSY